MKDKEEDRSNIGFVGARVDHSYDVGEAFDVTAEGKALSPWGGTNDQEAFEGAYVSRSDDDGALIMAPDPNGQMCGRLRLASDQRKVGCLCLFASPRRQRTILSRVLDKLK